MPVTRVGHCSKHGTCINAFNSRKHRVSTICYLLFTNGETEDAQEDAEKTKGIEGGSKGIRTSGESEGECAREHHPAACAVSQAVTCV